jgi:hypothetical protein
MTLSRPALSLTVDGRDLTGPEAAAAAVRVELRCGAALDRALVALGPLSPVLDVAPDTTVEVGLGIGDDVSTVLTGSASAVWHRPWGTVVEVLTAGGALARTRVGRAYVQQAVADIVNDLLSSAGVDPGDIDASLEMGVYHADERRTAWQHLQVLATLTGCVVRSGADGSVHFTPPRIGNADHLLRGGAELMAWGVGGRPAGEPPAPAAPVSAAAERGSDAWQLWHHEPDGGGVALMHPAVRDRDAADAYEDAVTAVADRLAAGGIVTVTGDADVRAGDLVELDDVPRAADTYRVVSADHVLDRGGFATRLRLEAAA